MHKHTDAVLAALAGFVLTGVVLAPPALTAHAEKAARIAVYDKALGPDATRFGSERAGRLAGALQGRGHRGDAGRQVVAAQAAPGRTIR